MRPFGSVLCSQYQIFPRSRDQFSTLKKEPKIISKPGCLFATLHSTCIRSHENLQGKVV